MDQAKSQKRITVAHVKHMPRRSLGVAPQIQPSVSNDENLSTTNTRALRYSIPSALSDHARTDETILPSAADSNKKTKTTRPLSPEIKKNFSAASIGNIDNLIQIKDSNQGGCNWYNRLTPKQQKFFVFIITILIILAVAGAVMAPVYLFVIRQIHLESSFTNITVSACSASTCIGKETPYRSSIVTALYPFDGNVNDLSGYATGTAFGGFTYTPQGYVSQACVLTAASSQYILIPNVNLAKQSFTLQTWLYTPPAITNPSDFGIFGQCDTNSICLSLSLRNGRITLSFDAMNSASITLIGASVISTINSWVHVTVVYDATILQQQIYVNGKIDAVSHGIINSYQGVSSGAVTTIGRSISYVYPLSYYTGRIDHFTITAGVARNSCQILNDATLVVYYPFDTTGTFNDYGVNLCNGQSSGLTAISTGRVNQAISFTLNTSYFQSQCFPKMRGGDSSYSFSLWVNPNSVTGGGTLVHLSTATSGSGSCYDFLVFTATGNLVLQYITTAPVAFYSIQGPIIPANTWTHVAVVYNNVNGIRLYINGQFSASSLNTTAITLQDLTPAMYMTLGNVGSLGLTPVCLTGSIAVLPGSFSGAIDEFRLYNRELDNQDLCVLANP